MGIQGSFSRYVAESNVVAPSAGAWIEPECGNNAVATPFGRPQVDKQNPVLVVLDDSRQGAAAAYQVGLCQLRLEYGVLQVVAKAAHGFEDLAQAAVVGDVVTDLVGLAHVPRTSGNGIGPGLFARQIRGRLA